MNSMTLHAACWPYRVIVVEQTSATDPNAYGYCSPAFRTIEIRGGVSFDAAFETLAHEYGHACEAAGIDLNQEDDEKRMTALATISCAFRREYERAGGDAAFTRLLGIAAEPDERQPELRLANAPGAPLIYVGTSRAYSITVHDRVVGSDGDAVWGLCVFDTQEIQLDASLDVAQRRRVLRHEIFHAFDWQYPGHRTREHAAEFNAVVATEIEHQIGRMGGWKVIDALFSNHAKKVTAAGSTAAVG